MNSFKDFGIKRDNAATFIGQKKETRDILNEEIIVHDYKIVNSKYQKNGDEKCLHLQISIDGTKFVVFTISGGLMELIQKIPKDKFPFTTTIIKIKETKRLEFT